jgi:hypothetical protein
MRSPLFEYTTFYPYIHPYYYPKRFGHFLLSRSTLLYRAKGEVMGPQLPRGFIGAARAGEQGDIERLPETVWVDAHRLARAVVAQAQNAKDAAQDACVIMFRNISSLRNGDASPGDDRRARMRRR